MNVGARLSAMRVERGLTVEQVASATRIHAAQIRALESDELDRFAAPVYAKGHLRTYADYLGLDANQLIAAIPGARPPGLSVGLGTGRSRPRFALTTQAVGAAGLVLLVSAFSGYAWRQMTADQRPAIVSPPPVARGAVGAAAPSASPAVQARPIVVGVRVTDTVWIDAVVDGTQQYGATGRTLAPGSVVYFTGIDVKVTSGKASATYITVDGRSLGAMGAGVATREFSSQTSP